MAARHVALRLPGSAEYKQAVGVCRTGMRVVAIAAGGTAGHVNRGLAVGAALEASVAVLFIGGSGHSGFEERLVEAAGYPFRALSSTPLLRESWRARGLALFNLARSVSQARCLLAEQGVAMVLGVGGYASVGPVLAARMLGIRTAILDCDASPGLANRWLRRFADTIYLGSASAAGHFPAGRTVATGVPLAGAIADLAAESRRAPPPDRPARILVLGGSEGSPFLNRTVPSLVHEVSRSGLRLEVRHQTGAHGVDTVHTAYADRGLPAVAEGYIADMAAAYRWADFAIACAGAGTLAELAAAGLPALLVPLASAAHDHQAENAAWFARSGAGWWAREGDFEQPAQAARIGEVLGDAGKWERMAAASRTLARPEAARVLAADLLARLSR